MRPPVVPPWRSRLGGALEAVAGVCGAVSVVEPDSGLSAIVASETPWRLRVSPSQLAQPGAALAEAPVRLHVVDTALPSREGSTAFVEQTFEDRASSAARWTKAQSLSTPPASHTLPPHGRATDAEGLSGPRGPAAPSMKRWQHTTNAHPEIEPFEAEVCRAVESPTTMLDGREPDEEWLYLEGAGPSRWLKVVVVFDNSGIGRVASLHSPDEGSHERDNRRHHLRPRRV